WRVPFGIVALEGMACGCLPIVSDGGGLPDAVGNAGVVFQRNNIESFYEKVQELLGNPILELSLRNNFNTHLKGHTTEVISKQYFKLLKSSAFHNVKN
ncbi:MAG TPA: glycosyltransferase, partial [Gillisia sp.]|nr:glycosyltransferase [Gillisia sp.]